MASAVQYEGLYLGVLVVMLLPFLCYIFFCTLWPLCTHLIGWQF